MFYDELMRQPCSYYLVNREKLEFRGCLVVIFPFSKRISKRKNIYFIDVSDSMFT